MVSVIIPIYNGKKYVQSAIKSVKNQSYKNIEIILIDDGSTDGLDSSDVLSIDSNIHFYSKNNEGLGLTRNLGITLAKGNYIFFLDADDTIPEGAIYKLRNAIDTNDFIIGRCKRVYLDTNNNSYKENIWKDKLFLKEHNKYNLIIDTIATNKLYKKEFLIKNHIKFLEGLYEDKLFVLKLFENTEKFNYIKETVYHWNIHHNSSSITSSFSISNLQERMHANYQCLTYTKDEHMKYILCKNIVMHDFKVNIVDSYSANNMDKIYAIYKDFIETYGKYLNINEFFLDRIIIENISNKKLVMSEFKKIYYENNSKNIFVKIKKYIRYSIYYLKVKLL